MIYTNDEADKWQRKKDYLLRVIVLPLVIGLVCFGVLYALERSHLSQPVDIKAGYWIILLIVLTLFAFNKSKWMKMPDGSQYHIPSIAVGSKNYVTEPTTYEEEFYHSNAKRFLPVFIGIVVVGLGIYLVLDKKLFLFAFISIPFGIFFTYRSIINMLDKSAQLKIAKEGIWTKKLGFIPWKEIVKAKVKQEKTSDGEQLNLEIWLKETPFAQAGKPDQVLELTDVKNSQYVETIISNFFQSIDEINY